MRSTLVMPMPTSNQSQCVFLGVGDDVNLQLFTTVQLGRLSQPLIVYLVQGISSITDQFPKKNLFVGIIGIDDERHELGKFCLEGKSLYLLLSMVHFLRHLNVKRCKY